MRKMIRSLTVLTMITLLVACASSDTEGNGNNNNNTFGDTTSSTDATSNTADTGTTLVTPDNGTTQPPAQTPLQQCQGAVNCLQACVQTQNCQDDACYAGCQTTCTQDHPEGWALYMEIETCLQTACAGIMDQTAMQFCALAEQASGGACFQQASACGLQGGAGNCNQLTTCIYGCAEGDANCQQQCLLQAGKQGINDFDAWNTCLSTACNQFPQGTPEAQQCIQDAQKQSGACFAQTDACGMATGTGSATCKDTLICLIQCAEGDTSCNLGCTQAASQDGIDQFNTWNECLNTACSGIPAGSPALRECVTAAQNEGGACFEATSTCGLYGTSTCAAVDACIAGCQDYNCLYNCLYSGTPNGQALFSAWNACLSDACYQPGQPCQANPQGPECGQCQGANCQTEKAACDADGGTAPAPSPFMHSFDPNASSSEHLMRAYENARVLIQRTPFKFYNPYN